LNVGFWIKFLFIEVMSFWNLQFDIFLLGFLVVKNRNFSGRLYILLYLCWKNHAHTSGKIDGYIFTTNFVDKIIHWRNYYHKSITYILIYKSWEVWNFAGLDLLFFVLCISNHVLVIVCFCIRNMNLGPTFEKLKSSAYLGSNTLLLVLNFIGFSSCKSTIIVRKPTRTTSWQQ